MRFNIEIIMNVGMKKDTKMNNYRLEFDMKLMTYVLTYKGKEYPLNVGNKKQAFERAEIVMATVDEKTNDNHS